LDEDEADHVFDRFYRGSSSKGGSVPGTGLGLAIVETLARRWGGSARLVNRPDGGARAEVRFPIAQSRVAKRATKTTGAAAAKPTAPAARRKATKPKATRPVSTGPATTPTTAPVQPAAPKT